MNKIILSLAIGLSLLAGCNAPKEVAGDDRSLDFTADWAFRLGDDTAAARLDYNDADWRKLNLPHDWLLKESSVGTIRQEQGEVLCLVV